MRLPDRTIMAQALEENFGRQPEVWVRAPGRVDLMGSHTDYNDGRVLTMTLDRELWLAAAPRGDRLVRVVSLDLGQAGAFSLDRLGEEPREMWLRYLAGVALEMERRGHPCGGFDAVISSTIPLASGLSSSAALEAATACLIECLAGHPCGDRLELARLCQTAEREFVGVSCGLLDQYTVLLGRAGSAILLDCRSQTHTMTPLPAEVMVVIGDTRAPRELAGSQYRARREQCQTACEKLAQYAPDARALCDIPLEVLERHERELEAMVARRARFILEENGRVRTLSEAMRQGRIEAIGEICAQSYRGARDLYEIVNEPMAAMHQAMTTAPGVLGARQAGAGFGGCLVAFVRPGRVAEFIEQAGAQYARRTGRQPEFYPARPSAGAGLASVCGNPKM